MGGSSPPAFAEDTARITQALTAPTLVQPGNGITGARLTQNGLSWSGTGALLNDIYFGTTSPPPIFAIGQYGTEYLLPPLNPCTTYYWKVVAKDSTGSASSPTWSFTTLPSVSFSPTLAHVAGSGGTGTISVSSDSACTWNAFASGITLTPPVSGTGNGTVSYAVPPSIVPTARTLSITIGDKVFLIRQDAGTACTYAISGPAFIDASQQTIAISVTTGAGCPWGISSTAPFLPAVGVQTGSQTLTLAAAANNTNAQRSISITVTDLSPAAVGSVSFSITQRQTVTTFADVPVDNPFFDAINLLRGKSITGGCQSAPLSYCPNDAITRGQMAIFIVRSVMGSDSFSYGPSPYFSDVPPTHPYFKWIQKLFELGVTGGCTTGQYCPDSAVTRGQMAVFIIRARFGATYRFSYPATPLFSDVTNEYPFFSWIQKLGQIGITAGCTTGMYCPDDTVTRGAMAVFVMRGGFNQLLPANTPIVTSIFPSSISLGQSISAFIAGQSTNFAPGLTQVDAGPSVLVGNVTVLSPTLLSVQLTTTTLIQPSTLGPHSITVTSPGSVEATLPNGFFVK
jgi:hypothetical protein